MVNPYAKYLGDRNPFEVVAATASRLEQLLGQMGPERADKSPAPGKWSIRQIVAHLADCELVFAHRMRQVLAEENPTLVAFDQEAWARNLDYARRKPKQSLDTFRRLR